MLSLDFSRCNFQIDIFLIFQIYVLPFSRLLLRKAEKLSNLTQRFLKKYNFLDYAIILFRLLEIAYV